MYYVFNITLLFNSFLWHILNPWSLQPHANMYRKSRESTHKCTHAHMAAWSVSVQWFIIWAQVFDIADRLKKLTRTRTAINRFWRIAADALQKLIRRKTLANYREYKVREYLEFAIASFLLRIQFQLIPYVEWRTHQLYAIRSILLFNAAKLHFFLVLFCIFCRNFPLFICFPVSFFPQLGVRLL